jgi:hypothetical protein
MRRHGIQRRDDVVERVRERLDAPILDAVKGPREIVQRSPAVGQFPDLRVDVQPDEDALGVVILAALPAVEALPAPVVEDRLLGGVLETAPVPAGATLLVVRGITGKNVAGESGRPEAGTTREDDALGQALDPHPDPWQS